MTSKKVVDRAARGLTELSETIAGHLGRPPTLAELTEVLGWAAAPLAGKPVAIKPKARGTSAENETADLPDVVFVDATDLVTGLASDVRKLGDILLAGLRQAGQDVLSDVDPADITSLKVEQPKVTKRVKSGDIIGIPVDDGKHLPAVVITKNDFGLALGLFSEPAEAPVTAKRHPPTRKQPVYTGEELIADGTWPVLGHDKKLVSLFPAKPEIYHRPTNDIPGMDMGPHGSAESPDGSIRQLTEAEAKKVGLLSGDYRQTWLPEDLQEHLR